MDDSRETVHGISAAGDIAVSSLYPWRTAWFGRRDVGELFSSCGQYRLLDERCVRFANSHRYEANHRARTHADARPRQRRLPDR